MSAQRHPDALLARPGWGQETTNLDCQVEEDRDQHVQAMPCPQRIPSGLAWLQSKARGQPMHQGIPEDPYRWPPRVVWPVSLDNGFSLVSPPNTITLCISTTKKSLVDSCRSCLDSELDFNPRLMATELDTSGSLP